jgi:hypothetical protein
MHSASTTRRRRLFSRAGFGPYPDRARHWARAKRPPDGIASALARRLPKRVSPKAQNFGRARLRLEGVRGKKREQRIDPLVQSSASSPASVRRELNDICFLDDVRWARPSRLGGRRHEARIGVHRPPPWVDLTAAPLGRVSHWETLIGIKIFDVSKITRSADQACHDP